MKRAAPQKKESRSRRSKTGQRKPGRIVSALSKVIKGMMPVGQRRVYGALAD